MVENIQWKICVGNYLLDWGDQLTGGVELTVRDEYSAICLRKIDRQRHIFAIKMRRGTGKLCNVQSIQ